ncbi:hypothetical protein Pve01_10050 [Planomonospora venezuelensis]|nr:hypothetical protein Pve01_10050 [Planomonospora venezuelensis]
MELIHRPSGSAMSPGAGPGPGRGRIVTPGRASALRRAWIVEGPVGRQAAGDDRPVTDHRPGELVGDDPPQVAADDRLGGLGDLGGVDSAGQAP